MVNKIIFLALSASVAASLNITLCSDTRCKNEPLATLLLDETSGCRTDFAGHVLAAKVIQENEDISKAQKARFYRSTDCFGHCGSGHLIHQLSNGGALMSSGLRDPAPLMQSFEVVTVNEDGKYEPDGYCGIRHGDAQFFRGRTWKWQQIGKDRYGDPVFREIPLEDWDDTMHPQQNATDYTRHGSVDHTGKIKQEQYAEGKWGGIPLEMWDESLHVCNNEPYDIGRIEKTVSLVRKKMTGLRGSNTAE